MLATFWQHGRAVCPDVSWVGLDLRLVSAHLSPDPEAHLHIVSLDDLRHFLNALSSNRQVVIGSDTQDALGPLCEDSPPDSMGQWALDGRGWNGQVFLELLSE